MKTSVWMGLVLTLISARGFAAEAGAAEVWKPPMDGRATIVADKLTLAPADMPWDRVAALGAAPITFWNREGATVHVKMSLRATTEGNSRDVAAFLGFTSSSKADTYQSADNVVGLYLDYSRKAHRLYVSLVHKEKNGDNAAMRGDEWGNLAPYVNMPVEIPGDDPTLDITLAVNQETVSASIKDTPFTQSFPLGLTGEFWKRAFLMAQCMNVNDGRGSVTLEATSLAAKPAEAGADAEIDYKKRPPDSNIVPDQITLKTLKRLGDTAFSVAGSSSAGEGGKALLAQKGYADFLRSFGGISRFPYGLEISFYFWPYEARDWLPVLGQKGGTYGTIERWYYPNSYKVPEKTLSYQTMLAAYKKRGLKLILLFNVHAMFNGHDFVYVKTLPEEKMKTTNPLQDGQFSRSNLQMIVKNNETLMDYVISHGYTDTVACWEMDNERWDMPGKEYAECVAAHVKMLRRKLPKAKVIVCLGDLPAYSRNAEREHGVAWSRDVLIGLREARLTNAIDYFAPHLYPFLFDKAEEIVGNQLEDWNVRNAYRSFDYLSAMLDAQGFTKSKFYVSEWGAQSDGLIEHNNLITSMAEAISTAKEMMAIYSHPRVEGATWHQFLQDSYVSKALHMPLSQWGEQTVFVTDTDRYITTPPSEAVKLFVTFARGATLLPVRVDVPKGVHYLCASDATGKRYFVINSTGRAVAFPASGLTRRTTLSGNGPTATSILSYGKYGDSPGEIAPIVPRDYAGLTLPPYSINVLH